MKHKHSSLLSVEHTKSNQKGFGVVEVFLAIVVIALVAGIGWYVMHRSDSKKANQEASSQTTQTKAYADTAQIYNLRYPSAWVLKEAEDCCDGAPPDHTVVSRSVTIAPSDKLNVNAYGLHIQSDKTGALAKSIEQNWTDNKHVPETRTTTNGYVVKYVKVVFNGDAENYVDHNYLFTNKDVGVYVTYREKYQHQNTSTDWSAAQDLEAFDRIVQSISLSRTVEESL